MAHRSTLAAGRLGLVAATAALLCLAATSQVAAVAETPPWWQPQRYNTDGTLLRFQYQLADNGKITVVPGVQVYAIDFDTAETAIKTLRKANKDVKIICYFSAGSWENYRVDDDQSKRGIKPTDWGKALGNKMDGWPGERWVDVRSQAVRGIMTKRLSFCKDIGCDGVDPDNINGYESDESGVSRTGFPLTKQHLLDFNTFLANTAHGLGLAIGLKNGLGMIPQLHLLFDWAINEECYAYGECGVYSKFASTKPIWGIEYCNGQKELGSPTQDPSCFCPRALASGFNFLVKKADLQAPGISCTQYCKKYKCGSATATGSCKAKKINVCDVVPAKPALG